MLAMVIMVQKTGYVMILALYGVHTVRSTMYFRSIIPSLPPVIEVMEEARQSLVLLNQPPSTEFHPT